MRVETLILIFFHVLPVFTASCSENPSQQQCLAYNNRFILPSKLDCNPFKKNCRMGDLVSDSIARCQLMYPGNIQHSLNQRYKIKYGYCRPKLQTIESATSLTVSASAGELQCMSVELRGKEQFTCGEKGTRCVCHSPEFTYIEEWESYCRCQYFIDYCTVSKVCTNPEAVCHTKGNQVMCTCPLQSKSCTPGINQCTIDPGICEEHEQCIELYDEFKSWFIGAKQSRDGFACVRKNDMQLLQDATTYCSVSTSFKNADKKARNHIDACCFRQLICGTEDNQVEGNILKYRPCHCNTVFRNCLRRHNQQGAYTELANAVIRTMNQQKLCEMNEQNSCDPRRPKTCRQGDLINPKIAHCHVNCKSGPLLPIGQRMCSIRQCKPPFHVVGVRIIDVPNKITSSLCKAVRLRPYLCGKGDTRCVCDSRPSSLAFTDRCRCQFWPLQI